MAVFPVQLGVAGLLSAAVAAIAWMGDRRRMRRADLDAVGFMPWTVVFLWAFLAACVLLGLAGKAWLAS